MNNRRLIFKYAGRLIFLVSFDEVKLANLPIIDLRPLSEFFFSDIISEFKGEYMKLYNDTLALKEWLEKFDDKSTLVSTMPLKL